ncbi:unnamed protein product [Plutella xylostella]|uniref:(diamondback moth) hypothetical protein n=1 Tax=Plutella xylostella TaxID=51655 RepID=A0A8S4GD59_PLUXY|nr:unnamed protein product [Plutella xylostella]
MNKPKWKCESCKAAKLGSPIIINRAIEEPAEMSSIINIDTESIINLINRRFDSLKSSIDDVNVKLTQLTDTVSSFDQRMLTMEARIDSIQDTTAKLSKENESLSKTIEHLKMEMNFRDQELLANDIEISGVPELKEESVGHIVQLVTKKLGLNIEERDIVKCSRAGPARLGGLVEGASGDNSGSGPSLRPRPIAVRLARRELKDKIISEARVRRGATTADCGLPGPPRRFYVNERLTRTNRFLFNKTREEANRHGWKFVWTKEGRVLVRREQGKASHRIRSINTGQDELLVSIDRHKPDILALNETWLKEGQDLCAPKVPGYVLKLSPRPGGRKGGGVGFYIRRGLNARVREHPDSALEQLWLEVRPRGMGRIAVGTAYRPDSSSKTRVPTGVAIDALSESISSFGECSLVCVMTDFNVDLLKPSLTPAPEVLTFFQQQNLTNLVNEPTRVVENSATLLDLIITDNPQLFRNLSVHHNPSLSDHAMVLVDLAIKIPKEPPQYVWTRVLSKIDEKNFLQDLKEQPWSEILKYDDVEIMTSHFNDLLTCIFDKHSPLKRIRINQRPRPWLTDVGKHMMFLRDKAWSKALATKTERHRRYFKDLKNLVNSAIKSEKRAYFNFFVNNNLDNLKQMWKHLKQTAGVSGNAALPSIPKVLNDPEKINSFFLDVPGDARADNKLVEFFKENKFTESQFSIDNCSEEEVAKIINSINTNASGHGLIFDSIGMIRMTLVVTLPIITRIINKSISSKKIPDTWKIAKVIPLPKGTIVEEFKDLRPISILPVLSKIVERVVYTQLSKYLEAENILPDMQSGFRGEHGTSTALAHVTDEIIQALDSIVTEAY